MIEFCERFANQLTVPGGSRRRDSGRDAHCVYWQDEKGVTLLSVVTGTINR